VVKAKTDALLALKKQIIAALSHPEADEGLYFRNLFMLHEVDERPPVLGTQEDIATALEELVREGRVKMRIEGPETIYELVHH